MGEITVLATASIGAVALARVGRRVREAGGAANPATLPAPQLPVGGGAAAAASPVSAPAPRLPFVEVSVRIVFPVVMLLSLWLLFAGHNQPGGGFVGGLLAGAALTLRYVAGGIDEVRDHARFRPWTVLGLGLLVASVTASIPLLLGESVLEVEFLSLDLPALGDVTLSSALVFDTGVYLAVVGMVLMVFEAFGDEPAVASS
jgi:multicomponent Na+:H+ antiporter subunit A